MIERVPASWIQIWKRLGERLRSVSTEAKRGLSNGGVGGEGKIPVFPGPFLPHLLFLSLHGGEFPRLRTTNDNS